MYLDAQIPVYLIEISLYEFNQTIQLKFYMILFQKLIEFPYAAPALFIALSGGT